jgi:protease I
MTKKIAIMVDEMYQVLELWYPFYRFKEAGYSVELIGAEKGRQYQSKEGYPAVATMAAGQAEPDQFVCMIVPGGYAPDHMRRSADMVGENIHVEKSHLLYVHTG